MNKLSEKIIKKIKQKNIQPTPKIFFKLQNFLVWTFFIFSIICGAISLSAFIAVISGENFFEINYFSTIEIIFFFGVLPLIWIFFLVAFLIFGNFVFRKTSHGYKFSSSFLFLANFGALFLLGIIIFFAGIGENLEKKFAKDLPGYKHLVEERQGRFYKPELGRIAGEIIEISKSKKTFLLF